MDSREDVLTEVYLSCRGLLSFLVGPVVGYQNADDVIQDSFLKVLKSQNAFPEPADARRYLKKVAMNGAMDLAKARNRFLPLEEQDGLWQMANSDPLSGLMQLEQERERDRLCRKAVGLLEQSCQRKGVPVELFLDAKVGTLTNYSRKLGVPISTLRSRRLAVQRQVSRALNRGVRRWL